MTCTTTIHQGAFQVFFFTFCTRLYTYMDWFTKDNFFFQLKCPRRRLFWIYSHLMVLILNRSLNFRQSSLIFWQIVSVTGAFQKQHNHPVLHAWRLCSLLLSLHHLTIHFWLNYAFSLPLPRFHAIYPCHQMSDPTRQISPLHICTTLIFSALLNISFRRSSLNSKYQVPGVNLG